MANASWPYPEARIRRTSSPPFSNRRARSRKTLRASSNMCHIERVSDCWAVVWQRLAPSFLDSQNALLRIHLTSPIQLTSRKSSRLSNNLCDTGMRQDGVGPISSPYYGHRPSVPEEIGSAERRRVRSLRQRTI